MVSDLRPVNHWRRYIRCTLRGRSGCMDASLARDENLSVASVSYLFRGYRNASSMGPIVYDRRGKMRQKYTEILVFTTSSLVSFTMVEHFILRNKYIALLNTKSHGHS